MSTGNKYDLVAIAPIDGLEYSLSLRFFATRPLTLDRVLHAIGLIMEAKKTINGQLYLPQWKLQLLADVYNHPLDNEVGYPLEIVEADSFHNLLCSLSGVIVDKLRKTHYMFCPLLSIAYFLYCFKDVNVITRNLHDKVINDPSKVTAKEVEDVLKIAFAGFEIDLKDHSEDVRSSIAKAHKELKSLLTTEAWRLKGFGQLDVDRMCKYLMLHWGEPLQQIRRDDIVAYDEHDRPLVLVNYRFQRLDSNRTRVEEDESEDNSASSSHINEAADDNDDDTSGVGHTDTSVNSSESPTDEQTNVPEQRHEPTFENESKDEVNEGSARDRSDASSHGEESQDDDYQEDELMRSSSTEVTKTLHRQPAADAAVDETFVLPSKQTGSKIGADEKLVTSGVERISNRMSEIKIQRPLKRVGDVGSSAKSKDLPDTAVPSTSSAAKEKRRNTKTESKRNRAESSDDESTGWKRKKVVREVDAANAGDVETIESNSASSSFKTWDIVCVLFEGNKGKNLLWPSIIVKIEKKKIFHVHVFSDYSGYQVSLGSLQKFDEADVRKLMKKADKNEVKQIERALNNVIQYLEVNQARRRQLFQMKVE